MTRKTSAGLIFENKVCLENFFQQNGRLLIDTTNTFLMGVVDDISGIILNHSNLYKYIKKENTEWKSPLSRKMIPDKVFLIPSTKRVLIFECKFQQTPGSADEKLQTCEYKKKQFKKLLEPLGFSIEYIYILSDWFKQPMYEDVRNYIVDCGCHFLYNEIDKDMLISLCKPK